MQNHDVTLLQRLEDKGRLFYVSNVYANQSAVITYLWKVGSKAASVAFSVKSTLKTGYTIKEAPTVTANGTPGTMLNRNRNYADDGMEMKRYTTPTVTGGTGTTIYNDQMGSATSPGQSSESPASIVELTLKKNTDYLVTITPSAANDITVEAFFWEDDQ